MQKTKVKSNKCAAYSRLLCMSVQKELSQHYALKAKIVAMGVDNVLVKWVFNYTVIHLRTQISKWTQGGKMALIHFVVHGFSKNHCAAYNISWSLKFHLFKKIILSFIQTHLY